MPQFHLHIKSISRSAGRSAPAAAAYRAGERIRDERTGALHNYSRRRDVVHTEILLPSALAGRADWALDRARLWNVAEAAERQRNSLVAREFQVSLPHELTAPQRLELARRFAHEIAERHGIVVDLAIHDPKPEGDPRNYHAHLLATTREASATGLEGKAGLDLSYAEGLQRGLAGRKEMHFLRERWAALTNEAYRDAGLDLRVDHRSLAEQGIDRAPQRHLPFVAYQMERRRLRREIADSVAERYRERVAENLGSQAAVAATDAVPAAPTALGPHPAAVEELQRRARESWLALRREAAASAGPQRERATPSAEMDEDLSL